eukprot:606271-Rhodomonas_salina.1
MTGCGLGRADRSWDSDLRFGMGHGRMGIGHGHLVRKGAREAGVAAVAALEVTREDPRLVDVLERA